MSGVVVQRAKSTTISYGWRRGLMRYNRVEGLSFGALGERKLGKTYDGSALVRLGTGDLEPNVELRVARGDEQRSMALTGYHRLDSANDWGDPFGLGGSLSALVVRSRRGLLLPKLGRGDDRDAVVERCVERHVAAVRASASTTRRSRRRSRCRMRSAGREFEPNVTAIPATEGGASARLRAAHGLDPRGFRLSADLRAEAATGTFDYTRGAPTSRPRGICSATSGCRSRGGAGTSGGTLSPQRAWFIGGTNTVRGFRPGTLTGDSYWLARAELACRRVGDPAGCVLRRGLGGSALGVEPIAGQHSRRGRRGSRSSMASRASISRAASIRGRCGEHTCTWRLRSRRCGAARHDVSFHSPDDWRTRGPHTVRDAAGHRRHPHPSHARVGADARLRDLALARRPKQRRAHRRRRRAVPGAPPPRESEVGRASWGLSENNRKAKYYTLTAAGRARLKSESAVWNRYADAVPRVESRRSSLTSSMRRPLFQFPWRSRRQIARDVDTELAFHLDMRVTELVAAGVSADEARRQAVTEFGDLEFDARVLPRSRRANRA